MRIAETVEHPVSLANALAAAGRVSLRQGDFPKAIPLLERGLRVCQDTHLPLFFPRLASALGVAYTQTGRLAEGLALLEQAVEQSTAMQIVYLHALWLIHLGEGYRLARLAWRRPPSVPCTPWNWCTPTRNGGHQGRSAPPRRHRRVPRAPRGRGRRNPLSPGPHPSRGTWYASAPGPLPPGPGRAVCQDGSAGAGPCRTLNGHRSCIVRWR